MSHTKANILVVDDDEGGRYLKAHVLRKHGFRVTEAATGMAAIEQCCASAPDLVLLDVMLPDVNGIEVSRRIKTTHPGIAVLQTSAAITDSHDRAAALDGGADGFLVEPIEPEELLATAQALLRMRGAEQALRRMNESLELLVAERTRELTDANRQLEIESAERRKAEEVLWHAQKLDAVGQLTGGIAHDFNNLLAVIVGSIEMIQAAFEGGGDLPRAKILRLLKASETATGRATKLTQQLLAFARRSTFTLDIVSLDEVLVACEPFLRRALGEDNVLDLNFGPDLWSTRIDTSQFEAAILNLVVNARDAMPLGGKLEIATGNVTIDATEARRSPDLTPGCYVLVRITDTGTGMDPDVAARAFEPFFTTKEVGKGTGLGLSQVYGFIKQSGGHVMIDTAPGAGTTFRLYVPRCDATPRIERWRRPRAEGDAGRTRDDTGRGGQRRGAGTRGDHHQRPRLSRADRTGWAIGARHRARRRTDRSAVQRCRDAGRHQRVRTDQRGTGDSRRTEGAGDIGLRQRAPPRHQSPRCAAAAQTVPARRSRAMHSDGAGPRLRLALGGHRPA